MAAGSASTSLYCVRVGDGRKPRDWSEGVSCLLFATKLSQISAALQAMLIYARYAQLQRHESNSRSAAVDIVVPGKVHRVKQNISKSTTITHCRRFRVTLTLATDQGRRQDLGPRGGGAQNYVELFVAHKMTRNNTLSRVRRAAILNLPQLLLQNTMFGEKPHKIDVILYAALKLTEKIHCWKSRGHSAPGGQNAPVPHSWRRRCDRSSLPGADIRASLTFSVSTVHVASNYAKSVAKFQRRPHIAS